MLKKIKNLLLLIFAFFLSLPNYTQALGLDDFRDQVFRPDNLPAPDTTDISAEGRVNEIIDFAINLILYASGSVAVLILIIGGIMYITSMGSDDNMDRAKRLIKYAAIGLAVVLGAFVLTNIISDLATGAFGAAQ